MQYKLIKVVIKKNIFSEGLSMHSGWNEVFRLSKNDCLLSPKRKYLIFLKRIFKKYLPFVQRS